MRRSLTLPSFRFRPFSNSESNINNASSSNYNKNGGKYTHNLYSTASTLHAYRRSVSLFLFVVVLLWIAKETKRPDTMSWSEFPKVNMSSLAPISSVVSARRLLNEHTPHGITCTQTPDKCTHMVTAANGPYVTPLLACINSVQTNSAHVRPVMFHIIVPPADIDTFEQPLSDAVKDYAIEFIAFNDSRIAPLIRVWEGLHPEIYYNTFNYARFYLPYMLPNVTEMVYLDPDTVTLSDLSGLTNQLRQKRKEHLSGKRKENVLMMAVNSKHTKFGLVCKLLNCNDAMVKKIVTKRRHYYFNAGVFATDLSLWREYDITGEIERVMHINTERRLWRWGSQGPMVLVFYNKWVHAGYSWNERGAGLMTQQEEKNPNATINVFHFTSHKKPWRANGRALWHLWCPWYPHPESFWFCKEKGFSDLIPSSPMDFSFLKHIAKAE
eukprot:TRINITY_DN12927_c0_g1_i1.p1 TRINITY_DN12927_c0_g1~~TRINITY_DN12927_c0_g1_i1.p1  ORF type:complete len:439 (+),score=71.92 TRINITY_DN12927_c0_g1_i1:395-1711(+)